MKAVLRIRLDCEFVAPDRADLDELNAMVRSKLERTIDALVNSGNLNSPQDGVTLQSVKSLVLNRDVGLIDMTRCRGNKYAIVAQGRSDGEFFISMETQSGRRIAPMLRVSWNSAERKFEASEENPPRIWDPTVH
jgi:hypothetical protein